MNTLYLDMDGVVADFDEYAMRTLGVPPSQGIYSEDIWKKLASNPRIYQELHKTPYADHLFFECSKFAKKNNYQLMFLTAVPKGNDVPWAFYDKVYWARHNFPTVPVMFGPYSKDKYKHCKTGDILIDDRRSNIEEWTAAGGISILHQDVKTTIEQLNQLVPQVSLQA